jgi:uncharacterized protein YcbK (DUF882 family)
MRSASVVLFVIAAASAASAEQKPKLAVKPQGVSYAEAVRKWHAATPNKAPATDPSGRPLLVLEALNINERLELRAASERGGFSGSDLDRAAHLLREPWSGNEHPIEPRLLDLAYRLQTHFKAQAIRVVSAYRTPHGGASNHGRGRALDLIVPGARDEEVAKFARELGYVGVGIYPVSGFVHLDVRDRSYFWVDSSGPGRKNRERGILGDLAQRADQRAAARGEHPMPALALSRDVDGAMGGGGPSNGSPQPADEDEDAESVASNAAGS